MVSRSGLRHAAVASYAHKLQCLKIQVGRIARERDKARLDLEKVERRCLRLGKELDEQHLALQCSQSRLRDVQAEMEAKELLLQQAVNHQAKLEADTQFLQGKETSLRGRLNLTMRENVQLQNRVLELAGKLAASEELVLELQRELSLVVNDKLGQEEPHSLELQNQSERFTEIVQEYERQCQVLWEQNGALRRELEGLRLQLRDSRAEGGLPAAGHLSPGPLVPSSVCTETSITMEQLQEQLQDLKVQLETKVNYYEEEIELMRKNFEREKKDSKESFRAELSKVEGQKRDLEETIVKFQAVTGGLKEQKCVQSLELKERFEMEQTRVGLQRTEDVQHARQQLGQEGEELRAQCRDRGSLRKHVSKLGRGKAEKRDEAAELMEMSEKNKGEVSQLHTKVLQGVQMAPRQEHHQQHAACWSEMELLWQQLEASQEKLFEAKASLSLAQTQHALQLQQAKAQMSNMVPKKQFEQLLTTLREEQRRAERLQENLQQQAEQACRQLVRTQEEHERLLQVAVEQAERQEHALRSAEAMLADRAARLEDTQAQLSRNRLLIEDLREENRGFAMALQAAELKQKSTEQKNQVLQEQALALKELVGKITPASLSA